MTNSNGKPKTVAELREVLARLSEERDRYLATIAEAETGIKECARAIFEGDGEATEKRKGFKMRRNGARDAVEQIDLILPDIQRELAEAIDKEDQERRESDAGEAKAFAIRLGSVFGEVDKHLAEFRSSYAMCFALIREARSRRWSVPSEEMMVAKMNRALKSAFSVAELRGFDMPPLPAPERCTFGSIGEAYARGIQGGAMHMVNPPTPPPQPTRQAAKKPDEVKLPPQGDVGMKFKDDPREFEIRIPTAR